MRKLFENRRFFGICCALLCAAFLASLLLPAAGRGQRQPDAPQLTADQDLTLLGGGSAEAHASAGASADAEVKNLSSGTAGGSEGLEGGNTAEDEAQTPETPQAPEEREQNTPAGEPDGAQQTQQPQKDPASTDDSDAEIGAADDGAQDPDDQTQQDDTGSDGEEQTQLDLAAVLTWYQYGNTPSTVVCAADERVGKRIVYSQLDNGSFSYDFELVGADRLNAEIYDVTVREGAGQARESGLSGALTMALPADGGAQRYTFTVYASVTRRDADGNETQTDHSFTFVVSCEDGLDLSLYMGWLRSGAETGLSVSAGSSASRTVRSSELDGGRLEYSFELRGLSAANAQIVSAVYTSDAGESGTLDLSGGMLELKTAPGKDTGRYSITVVAEVDEGGARSVEFQIELSYEDGDDLALELTWYKKSTVAETVRCEKNARAAVKIKQNQLVSGEFLYSLALTGTSAGDAQITSVSFSGPEGTQKLEQKGSVRLSVPAGESAAAYVLQVEAESAGRQVSFTINLSYASDVSVLMRYTTTVDGAQTTREVSCENGRSVSADIIYSDQLTDGALPFEILISGSDGESVRLDSVALYQSGTGRSTTLARAIGAGAYSGSAVLQTNGGRAGENQFTITAADTDGGTYTFTVNIPYLPRGDKEVVIRTNLQDGQKIENETDLDLTVEAWSQEADGTPISHIRAIGSETQLRVLLDGVELAYTGASGYVQQYKLYAKNPEIGDENTHELTIYARDEYGNEGELTLQLLGERSTSGKIIGTASISIDMTVLGLGVYGPISYDVMADEPVSYTVAKAVWGYDAGEPFGTASSGFGWDEAYCSYSGSLDVGFYLRSMDDGSGLGSRARVLNASSFDSLGANEEEILAAIDSYFGAGSDYAALWRCIYRNGIPLTGHSAMGVGDQDFTRGSGWLYCINGSFYPGSGMSEYSLQDGDSLTLRYTLAYGWDVGSGQGGYGDAVGYCVTARDGSIYVNHEFQEAAQADGTIKYVCRCCGLVEGCPHAHTEPRDDGEGKCGTWCLDCQSFTGPLKEHEWEYSFEEDSEEHKKTCRNCGLEETEAHEWRKGVDTATCTEPGVIEKICELCNARQEEQTPAKGHSASGQWTIETDIERNGPVHYQLCTACGEEIAETRGQHTYVYDAVGDCWVCTVCQSMHDWDCGGELQLVSGDCTYQRFVCSRCGLSLERTGRFEEGHHFENGVCTLCGTPDPNYVPMEPGGNPGGTGGDSGGTGGDPDGDSGGSGESPGESGATEPEAGE